MPCTHSSQRVIGPRSTRTAAREGTRESASREVWSTLQQSRSRPSSCPREGARSGGRGADRPVPGSRDGPSAGTWSIRGTAAPSGRPRPRVVPCCTRHNGTEASSSKVQRPRSDVQYRKVERPNHRSHQIGVICARLPALGGQVICGSITAVSSPLPILHISGTASPWRPARSGDRRPASGDRATGTPGERPLPPIGACPETSRRPRGTSRNT